MELKIRRKNGIPIYMQIKGQILDMIRTGQLVGGEQLPTERSWRKNYLSAGIPSAWPFGWKLKALLSYQGRGTFVATGDQIFRREGRKAGLKDDRPGHRERRNWDLASMGLPVL